MSTGKTPPKGRMARRILAVLALVAATVAVGWFGWSSWRSADLRAQAREATRKARWDDAERVLAKLQWYRPADDEVLKMRVQVALQRNDPETAVRVLAAVPPHAPDAERARMTRGRLLMELFRYREAEKVFRECVRLNPGMDEARIQLIILGGLKRKSRPFTEDLWAFFDLTRQPISALRMLARGFAVLPDRTTVDRTLDEGLLLERGLRADPSDHELRPPLARYYRDRGRTDDALALLEPWLREHPDDQPARDEWLGCRLDQGELDSLRPWFDRPPDAARESGRYWMLRGDWLQRQGRHVEAVDCFRGAARLEPRDAEPRFRLGMALRAAGRPDEAEAPLAWVQSANQLKTLIHTIPDEAPDPALLTRAGRLCAEMGRDREARAWLTLALRRDPQNAEARQALAALRR